MDGFSHTQKSPLSLLVYGTALALFVRSWAVRDEFPIAFLLGGTGFVTLLLRMAFHHLSVQDQGDVLAFRFGPVPLFHRTVR